MIAAAQAIVGLVTPYTTDEILSAKRTLTSRHLAARRRDPRMPAQQLSRSAARLHCTYGSVEYEWLPLPIVSLLPPGRATVAVVFGGIVTVNRCRLSCQSETTVPYAESYST